ncbi:hypothetical protein HN587_00570 [Candidatus Woesearchaeota archaeon]|jgi:hypothetical protein|nr:hypothetical protein [Candidatus Woesearchaeota archaeon]
MIIQLEVILTTACENLPVPFTLFAQEDQCTRQVSSCDYCQLNQDGSHSCNKPFEPPYDFMRIKYI